MAVTTRRARSPVRSAGTPRPPPGGDGRAVATIGRLDPERIVVGLPLALRGEKGAQALSRPRRFVAELTTRCTVPVDAYDGGPRRPCRRLRRTEPRTPFPPPTSSRVSDTAGRLTLLAVLVVAVIEHSTPRPVGRLGSGIQHDHARRRPARQADTDRRLDPGRRLGDQRDPRGAGCRRRRRPLPRVRQGRARRLAVQGRDICDQGRNGVRRPHPDPGSRPGHRREDAGHTRGLQHQRHRGPAPLGRHLEARLRPRGAAGFAAAWLRPPPEHGGVHVPGYVHDPAGREGVGARRGTARRVQRERRQGGHELRAIQEPDAVRRPHDRIDDRARGAGPGRPRQGRRRRSTTACTAG